MNYRKRHQLQHKIELSTLLKIVMTKKKKAHSTMLLGTEENLANQLATEAMELAEIYDSAFIVKNKKRRTVVENTKAFY